MCVSIMVLGFGLGFWELVFVSWADKLSSGFKLNYFPAEDAPLSLQRLPPISYYG